MTGRQVRHKVFGLGTVTRVEGGKIVVEFSGIEKVFQFPEAFGRFLSTEDAELQEMVARASVPASRTATTIAPEQAKKPKEARLMNPGSIDNWIIPCNPKYYDVYGAFRRLKTIDWRQTVKSIDTGDTVYIYSGRPIQAITHKCLVVRVNIPLSEADSSDLEFNLDTDDGHESLKPYDRYMRLQLITEYDPCLLPISKLVEYGLVGQIQGQRHTGPQIQAAIDSIGQ